MDDLISRQDAIDKIKDWMKFIGYSHSERNVMECTIQMLEELPSAEPKQKTGHWIYKNGAIVSPWYSSYECSECGCLSGSFKYCPECGSRNRGDEE